MMEIRTIMIVVHLFLLTPIIMPINNPGRKIVRTIKENICDV